MTTFLLSILGLIGVLSAIIAIGLPIALAFYAKPGDCKTTK
jgi:hypothetical protein